MSYCRWSCDDGQSDVYCYEDAADDIVIIHVAARRPVPCVPMPPPAPDGDVEAHMRRQVEVAVILSRSDMQRIGLPYDGMSFVCDGPREALAVLARLREVGYHVPQYAIDALTDQTKE